MPSKRTYFNPVDEIVPLPDLLENQRKSFQWFIDEGLGEVFEEIGVIEDYTGAKLALTFEKYKFEPPKTTDWEAKINNISYEAPLRATVKLVNKVTKKTRQQEIYLGDYPWMTDRATFVINGAERAVVSQLIRSAGVFFTADTSAERNWYGAKVIPGRGAWLEFETNAAGVISVKIDRRRKIPVTTLLRALGYSSNEQIKDLFAEVDKGEPKYIDATLAKDPSTNTSEALLEVYRRQRPGDLATVENAKSLLDNTFFNFKRFDFSQVGRYKLNKRLGLNVPITPANRIMRLEDLVAIIREIVRLNHSQEPADEIDSFANRRLKMVGELIQRQFRIGLLRMERNAKDRMSVYDIETVTPQQLLNARPVVASVREFFASSQLSQFMDQVNPLAELTHKRRLNAMGPGGLSRERAGFEVRDVHRTHYGRACVVETPEGQNIGLVLSLTCYARVNDYGFIETPYRQVIREVPPLRSLGQIARATVKDEQDRILLKKGDKVTASDIKRMRRARVAQVPVKARVTNEVVYLDASDEESVTIAEAGTAYDQDGYFVSNRVAVRHGGVPGEDNANNVDFLDVSPKQIIGATAALVPFIEKDDVNRVLMGAAQQRQAVPLIKPEPPIVGTGMEGPIAANSGQLVIAEDDGRVVVAQADRLEVRYKKLGKRVYNLRIFDRSNDGTAMSQKLVVGSGQRVKRGQLLADGMSTVNGELALGTNLLVAFLPWGGYNFEDSIIISQRLVAEDLLSSVHVEDHEVDVRETKLGPEQITRDIPNVAEEALADLDEDGIVRIGAEVGPGDILVGKITPKGEQELSSEERLLRAIFGEKAKDVRDTSLRMPGGKHGKVVGIKVFSRQDGHELKAGIIKAIRVFVAQMRKISVGDKLGGRHGNKGVISRILPMEDMPHLEDGTPVDIILNPLGVASRMNIGQIFETHLGWAAKELGMMVASPPFNGVSIDQIKAKLKAAGLPEDGKVQLYDGLTGRAFKEPTTVGYIYMNKLIHMVDDKIHARSTGPYTMVTQQPLGGKAQNGGQRFGEMEVWALEAYGVANTLQEMLTIKSDDVIGRSKAYESIIKAEAIRGPRLPESFKVLVKELQSLVLRVDLVQAAQAIEAEEVLEEAVVEEMEETKDTKLIKSGDEQAAVDISTARDDQYEALSPAKKRKAA
ncbi:DNA-directed RNA polymerase subunit beta [Candidatus Microgenomates bacterium]|nr:DNA-directed RNA polymerase subunit beta [Candidatus Microgenomates bacterium]